MLNLPGTEMSATSARAWQTEVAVPSSQSASNAAKKEVTDFLHTETKEFFRNRQFLLLQLQRNIPKFYVFFLIEKRQCGTITNEIDTESKQMDKLPSSISKKAIQNGY